MTSQLKTFMLLALLSGLIIVLGGALGGKTGIVIAFGLALIMNVGSYWYSDKIVLRMYQARELSESEAPMIYSMVRELAANAQIPMPRIAVVPEEAPNAFATGRNPENSVVAVTEGILRLLSPEELKGVLAHEIAHIANRDILIQTVAGVMASTIVSIANFMQFAAIFGMGRSSEDGEGGGSNPLMAIVLAILAPIAASLIQFAISRSREYLADASGARYCGQPPALAAALGLDELSVVGDIPRTLLLSDRLHLGSLSLDMLSDLISPVVTIAALGMIESLLCGASAARMKSESFHADQEFIAQGVGNILLPFFGGVPATAAIARTSVAIKSGQQTRLTSVFHSVFLLASMFLLGGVMARLPLSALAGVLMVTAWRMNDWAGIRYIFAHRFKSAISQFLVTMLATVVFDLTVAIILGVIYSAILYVARSSRIHVAFSTIDGNRLRYDVGKSPILDSAGVVYVTGSLFFGAVDEFNHRLQDIPEEDHLILSLRGMPSVDVSGAQAVLELCQRLLAKGHTIAFCGVAEDVRSYFDRAGVTALVGESAYFHSADRAILALLDEELLEA